MLVDSDVVVDVPDVDLADTVAAVVLELARTMAVLASAPVSAVLAAVVPGCCVGPGIDRLGDLAGSSRQHLEENACVSAWHGTPAILAPVLPVATR